MSLTITLISLVVVNSSSEADIITPSVEAIVELNGTSDYVNAQGYADITSGTLAFKGDATEAEKERSEESRQQSEADF